MSSAVTVLGGAVGSGTVGNNPENHLHPLATFRDSKGMREPGNVTRLSLISAWWNGAP